MDIKPKFFEKIDFVELSKKIVFEVAVGLITSLILFLINAWISLNIYLILGFLCLIWSATRVILKYRTLKRWLLRPLLLPCGTFILIVSVVFLYRELSLRLNKKLNVVVASFSRANNDEFSNDLFLRLNDDLKNDSIVIDTTKFISLKSIDINYFEEILSKKKYTRGLIIFGESFESSRLQCQVFIKLERPELSGSPFLRIALPSSLEFDVEKQADAVAQFIRGLLYSYSPHYESRLAAKHLLADALNSFSKTTANSNKRAIAYCNFYLGSLAFNDKNYNEAVKYFVESSGELQHSSEVHLNLGLSYLNNRDTVRAIRELSISGVSAQNSFSQKKLISLVQFSHRPQVFSDLVSKKFGLKYNEEILDKAQWDKIESIYQYGIEYMILHKGNQCDIEQFYYLPKCDRWIKIFSTNWPCDELFKTLDDRPYSSMIAKSGNYFEVYDGNLGRVSLPGYFSVERYPYRNCNVLLCSTKLNSTETFSALCLYPNFPSLNVLKGSSKESMERKIRNYIDSLDCSKYQSNSLKIH